MRAATHAHVALPPDAPLRPALEAAGVPVWPVAFRGRLQGTAALARVVRRVEPACIAAHTAHAHAHAHRLGTPPVVVHRRVDFRPRPLSRRRYRCARGYIAVSDAVAEVLAGVGVARQRIAVVRDGIDPGPLETAEPVALRPLLGLPPAARVVLAAGALVPHKGHRVLVEALSLLSADHHVAIAGSGPLKGRLGRQAARRGTAARLHLLGHRPDLAGLLQGADVFCHPSLEEGLGQVVVEAQLAGVPVVATRAGGLPEAVGRGGLLVPAGDPRALARALERALATGSALRAAVAADAHRLRARFSVERMVRGTESAYAALVG